MARGLSGWDTWALLCDMWDPVPCITRCILNHWATREVPNWIFDAVVHKPLLEFVKRYPITCIKMDSLFLLEIYQFRILTTLNMNLTTFRDQYRYLWEILLKVKHMGLYGTQKCLIIILFVLLFHPPPPLLLFHYFLSSLIFHCFTLRKRNLVLLRLVFCLPYTSASTSKVC